MRKKIAISVLAFMFVISLPLTAFVSGQPAYGSPGNTELLRALGFEIDSQSEKELTRAEMAKLFCIALGVTDKTADSSVTDNTFSDIASDKNKEFIKSAYSLGLVNGNVNGKFEPDKSVTYYEFAEGFVNLLGYKELAKIHGYSNYISKLKILSGISTGNSENVILKNVPVILENVLNASYLRMVSAGNTVEYKDDETLLSFIHKILVVKGFVTAIDQTSLYSSVGCGKNKIKIGDEYYDYKAANIDMLGRYVKAYYYEGDDNMQIKALDLNNSGNEEVHIKIDSGSRAYYENNYICYETDKTQKIKLSGFASCIYNGKYDVDYKINDIANISYGEIKLLDNNNDEIYDVIYIDEYVNYLVDGVVNNTLYDKYNLTPLDLDADYVSIYKNGTLISADSIKEWNVASVYISHDGSVIRAEVSDNAKYEEIIETQSQNEYSLVRIQDAFYEIYIGRKISFDLKVGDWGKFYFDAYDRVAGVDLKSDKVTYGFLSAASTNNLGSDNKFKIMTTLGKNKIFDANYKILFNGVPMNAGNVAKLIKNSPQIISFKTNNLNKISEINTVSDKGIQLSVQNFSGKYRSTSKAFASNYMIGDDTVIFGIPDNVGTPEFDSDDVTVLTSAYFTSGKTYSSLNFYDVDDFNISGAMLYRMSTVNTTMSKDVYFVTKVTQAITDDGEYLDKIYYKYNGVESYAYVNYNENVRETKGRIKSGQCIRVSKSPIGDIVDFEVLFSAPNAPDSLDVVISDDDSAGVAAELVCSLGTVGKKSETAFKLNNSVYIYKNAGTVKCYKYLENNNYFENTSYVSLKEGDRVFVVKSNDLVTGIVIINPAS